MDDIQKEVQERIRTGDLEAVKEKLFGRNMDRPFTNGWTPLLHACSAGENKIVDYLLDQGAGASCDYELFTPLMAVCSSHNSDEEKLVNCAKSLIKNNADLNAMDRFKTTALMLACTQGHEKLVCLLLDAKCDLDKFDNDGQTALHMACMHNYPSIARLLIEHGANVTIKDRRGRLPLDVAATKGLDEIVELLDEPVQECKKEEVTYVRKKTSFEELLTELPCFDNSSGKSGFQTDVKILLSGMRLEQKEDLFMQKRVGLSQFLNMKNKELKALGIHFSSHREKIITGNKRFIMHPWGPCSLPDVDRHAMNLMDVVRSLANSVKQLHILWATTVFCYERVMPPTGTEDKKSEDLYQITERAHRQTKALIKELKSIQKHVEYIDKVDGVQSADLIFPLNNAPKFVTARKMALASSCALFIFMVWKTNVFNVLRK